MSLVEAHSASKIASVLCAFAEAIVRNLRIIKESSTFYTLHASPSLRNVGYQAYAHCEIEVLHHADISFAPGGWSINAGS